MAANNEQFYLRYYSGHSGRFGHEFLGTKSNHSNGHNFPLTLPIIQLMKANIRPRCPPPSPEFDFRVLGDGRSATARYANNSNYRNDSLIRKESKFSPILTPSEAASADAALFWTGTDDGVERLVVCVSSLMIKEIKRIIKESEIMKYARPAQPPLLSRLLTTRLSLLSLFGIF